MVSVESCASKDTIITEDHEASERRNRQVYINQTTHMKNLKEQLMQISKKKKQLLKIMNCRRKWQPTPVFLPGESQVLGASVRNSAHGKGHEEGGLAYAKA